MIKLSRHPSAAALATIAAESFLERLILLQGSGHTPSVVLTGGTIADEIHRTIAVHPRRSHVNWSRVEFWFGDERFVSNSSPDRNFVQADAALLSHLPILPSRLHVMRADDGATTPEAAAAAYASDLDRTQVRRPFDIVMLGIGPDGHCASLFPGQSHVLSTSPVVVVPSSPKPPPVRISLTLPTLSNAHAVWFLASGTSKASAVAAALADGAQPIDVPASGPKGLTETVWFLDEDAASLL